MKINRRFVYIALLPALAAFIFSSFPALAQEEEEEDGRFGHLFGQAEAWIAQASGLDYFPATQYDPEDPFDAVLLSPGYSTETRGRYRFGYELRGNRGGLTITYYSHEELLEMTGVSPGNFIYGANLAHPPFAGFYNDGRVDAFRAETATGLRDLRIEYYRTAFSTPRATGKWYVGIRRIEHSREINAVYSSLIPPLPALIPPFYTPPQGGVGLDPQPETANLTSEFEGRGVGAGLDVTMPLWKDRLIFESGIGVTILRGKTDAAYSSTTWFYAIQELDGIRILDWPYSEFEDQVDDIFQFQVTDSLRADRLSSTAYVLDAYFGFRGKAWRGLDWLGGFRNTRYTDVAVDIMAASGSTYSAAMSVVERDRSVTYEGFYLGLAYRF